MAYYDDMADGYDELHGAEQDAKLAEFLGRIDLHPLAVVLDVGCGTGRSLAMLPGVHWHGIDPSAGLIARAPPEARIRIMQGVAESLPWPDASFDAVLSLTALQNFSDPAKGLAEMARVLKQGGIILLSFLRKSERAGALDALIRERFVVRDAWEQQHDRMYILAGSR